MRALDVVLSEAEFDAIIEAVEMIREESTRPDEDRSPTWWALCTASFVGTIAAVALMAVFFALLWAVGT